MSRLTVITTASPNQDEMMLFLAALARYGSRSSADIDLLVVDDLRLPVINSLVAGFSGELDICVVRPEKKGQLEASVQALLSVTSDVVVTIDPDMHLNIPDIDAFVVKWREGKQLVYGVRVERTDVSWVRLCLSRGFNTLIRVLFGVPLRDINTPMLLVAADIIPDIVRHDPGNGLVKVFFPHVLKGRFDEVEIRVMSPKKVSAYSYSRLICMGFTMLSGLIRFAKFRLDESRHG